MKNKIWNKAFALILCLVLLATTVSASGYTLDLSGDGNVNVWDIQVAVNENKEAAHQEAILDNILGGGDELHPNSDGVYEIYSIIGLNNMAKIAKQDCSFKLMNDIDLGGREWKPVANFIGQFNGNGKTISNVKITQPVGVDMGFFAATSNKDDISDRTRIYDLKLMDVEILIGVEDTAANYVGGIVGTNRGDLDNCTVVCSVTDARTTLAAGSYIGVQAGRNGNIKIDGNTVTNGKITGTNSMDALEYYDYEPQVGTSTTTQYKAPAKVNSMMAMNFADLSYPEGTETAKQYKRTIGIAGYSHTGGVPTDLVFQDITNSSKYDSQVLRDRRTAVTAAMYEMSTVEWTPHADITFYIDGVKSNYSRNGGQVYRGLPYNHGSSSIYRFYAYTEKNSDGRLQTVDTVPTYGFYVTDSKVIAEINEAYAAGKTTTASGYMVPADLTGPVAGSHQAGFPKYIGADCSSQTLMAWRMVNATSGTGKVTATHTNTMYACNEYIEKYGILPVNGFILDLPATDLDGDGSTTDPGDKSIAVWEFTRANKDYYMETLACTKKGDLLMDYIDEGGHTLMAMSDAVVIRNYKGVMDLDASYIITAEQGGSGGTRKGTTADGKTWTSSCCVDEVNSFNVLYDVKDTTNNPSTFFPITCAALREEDTPAAKVTISMKDGVVSSNFQIISSTVGGETVYAQIKQSGHRSAYNKLTVKDVHPNVATGDTVEVLLANGQTYKFTY